MKPSFGNLAAQLENMAVVLATAAGTLLIWGQGVFEWTANIILSINT